MDEIEGTIDGIGIYLKKTLIGWKGTINDLELSLGDASRIVLKYTALIPPQGPGFYELSPIDTRRSVTLYSLEPEFSDVLFGIEDWTSEVYDKIKLSMERESREREYRERTSELVDSILK